MNHRVLAFFASVVLLWAFVLPAAGVGTARAAGQSFAEGVTLSGDFRGNGRTQIASLYDSSDDLGLRIDILEGSVNADTLTRSEWYVSGSNTFDLARMKVAALDLDRDGRTDLAVLYDDGGTSVRILVFKSTGTTFSYAGSWWQSSGYAWDRVEDLVGGDFSGAGQPGLLLIYQYDGFQMRIHYLESTGRTLVYGGDAGVYDSGEGQYDATRAHFAVGHFTRPSGPMQLASLYQYPNARVRIHVFEPTPRGLIPVNGWGGVFDTGEGQYDLDSAKIVAGDFNGDGLTDLLSLYGYADGSIRVHLFDGRSALALTSTAGLVQLLPGTLAWGPTRVLAGDFFGDHRTGLVTVTPFANGSSEAALLRNTGAALSYHGEAWTTPWYEIAPPLSPIGLATSLDFCRTHACIPNFPNGKGYVVQCADGKFSQSGGRAGACSYHGGTVTHSGRSHYVATGGSTRTYTGNNSYRSTSPIWGSNRTQYVHGYYRRNGTYVSPYFRSPSRSRSGRGR